MSSSAICQNFVQNAWKKELCSNCFKSKDEHAAKPKLRPLPQNSAHAPPSIIRNSKRLRPKRQVCFPKNLTEVIGVGGEAWSDDEYHDDEETPEDEDFTCESEDDEEDASKELQRITKQNTDFNTTSLSSDVIEVKKTYSQLLLGQPIIDSAGRKQTPLLVSVTPFGEESATTKKRIQSNIPISTIKNKDTPGETTKSPVVLTSYTKNEDRDKEKSLLDEISETLEKGHHSIQIISRKKLVLAKPPSESDKENVIVKAELKPLVEKRVNLTRTPALKRDQEKPIIFQSNSKIELKNKLNKPEVNNNEVVEQEKVKVAGLPPLVPKFNTFPQSREQAGEPDGRADDSANELPALPTAPPPVLVEQPSFLHEKPKIPSKPTGVLLRKTPTLSTFSVVETVNPKIVLSKQDSNESDSRKRRAPKPPEESIYSRHCPLNLVNDSPVLREKEKRERSGKLVSSDPGGFAPPEPAPRKFLSSSTESLSERTPKEKSDKKARFSLKKFLRIRSGKEVDEVDQLTPPNPKPRLVIIHPQLSSDESKPSKPPPPPRSFDDFASKTPPKPTKSLEIIHKQRQLSRNNSTNKKQETVYANIGEVRSALVPNKPQRTASMREREALAQRQPIKDDHVYDYINRSSSPESDSGRIAKLRFPNKRSESSIDVSSDYFKYHIPRSMSLTYCGSETESEIYSPYSFYGGGSESEVTEDECPPKGTHKLRSRKGRSIVHKNLEDNYGAVVVANHEALAQVLENIQQTIHVQPALRGLKLSANLRWSDFSLKLSTRPVVVGKRVFHQALWGAQHVTLLVNAGTLNISTLSLGTFTLNPVTEFSDLIPKSCLPMVGGAHDQEGGDERLVPATIAVLPWLQVNTIQSFVEQLKAKAGPAVDSWKDICFVMLQLVNALKTLQAQGHEELPLGLNTFVLCKEMERESHHRLYILQGLSSELSKTDEDHFGSLCQCASKALTVLHQPCNKYSNLLQSLLNNERSVSLTQVKSILEFQLWGPSDVALGSTIREREMALQRWLDLQRATVLHGLVCARVQLTVYEEYHLMFLVRSNARMMGDASLLIESSNACK